MMRGGTGKNENAAVASQRAGDFKLMVGIISLGQARYIGASPIGPFKKDDDRY
jgi:hypothetical protein